VAPFNELNSFFGIYDLGLKSLFKIARLWIYLLMENQFKNILKKAKAIENGTHPIAKTFAGAIFQESNWFLSLQNFEITVPETLSPSKHTTKVASNALCSVLFLGDTFSGTGEDLLHKMILAMNLGKDKIKRIPFNENTDNRDELLSHIDRLRPEIVVSLGATVTNLILEKKEKLSSIHGQLIPLETTDWKYLMMPVFHPEFLLINPNMKRTAWNDLQKIMEFFKKDS
jgi:uracil-DNA glycosylase family 4